MKTGILVPVWRDYTWVAPITLETLRSRWAAHPEIWFCGLTEDEAGTLPVLPLAPGLDRSNWTQVLIGGVEQMRSRGFDLIYLILEEHLPVAPCHAGHLNTTLPALMESLPAAYISLMGWDNRRFSSRSALLDKSQHQLKNLVGPHDPRFHLHPALWRADILEACCRLALEDRNKNGSAWHFEKACARPGNPLPESATTACYQIRASQLAMAKPSALQNIISAAERFIFHKLMALYPLIPSRRAGAAFLRQVPFDDVFCNGPYPMFYSGIMAKGQLNRFFVNFLHRKDPALMNQLLKAMPRR